MKITVKKPALWIIAGVIALLCIVVVVAYFTALRPYDKSQPAWVHIPAEATQQQMADELDAQLGPTFGGRVMRCWSLMRGSDPAKAHGAYRIMPGDRPVAVARRLRNGRQTPIKLNFNNIRTINALAAKVASVMELDSAAFMAACDSLLPKKGYSDPRTFVAAFMPDQYEMYWTTPADKTVQRLNDYRDQFWNDQRRAQAKKLGLRPVEVATLASIVEKESNKRDEQPTIARLYLNRLHRNMPLQADPTVVFAVGDFSIRRVTGAHLQTQSPYNTYRNKGLPPGPIAMPAKATIDAVLNAPENDYLYMCASEKFNGYHNFAIDFATHQANARRYQAELNKRNIK